MSLITILIACEPCGKRDGYISRTKRVIINASGVEVILKSLSTEIDSINRDTITQFTHVYTIASGDSVVSIDECFIKGGGGPCGGGFIECKHIVGTYGFQVVIHNYARLIFDNRKVQTFHYSIHQSASSSIFNSLGYTVDRSDPNLPVSTYVITPEDYENAKPINP